MIENNSNGKAFMVYLVYIMAYIFPPLAIYGVYLAYTEGKYCQEEIETSHYRSQIRIFWISVGFWIATAVFGFIFPLVGALVGLVWILWSLFKIITGVFKLNRGKSV